MEFRWNLDTFGILGRKQWGKTTLAQSLLLNIPKENVLILDTNGEGWENFPRIHPTSYTPWELDKFLLIARQKNNRCIVLDDVDVYFSNAQITNELNTFLVNASHQNLGLIYTVKRPLNIPKLLLGESNFTAVGNFQMPNDYDYLKKYFINAPLIPQLKPYTFLVHSDLGIEFIMDSKLAIQSVGPKS